MDNMLGNGSVFRKHGLFLSLLHSHSHTPCLFSSLIFGWPPIAEIFHALMSDELNPVSVSCRSEMCFLNVGLLTADKSLTLAFYPHWPSVMGTMTSYCLLKCIITSAVSVVLLVFCCLGLIGGCLFFDMAIMIIVHLLVHCQSLGLIAQ